MPIPGLVNETSDEYDDKYDDEKDDHGKDDHTTVPTTTETYYDMDEYASGAITATTVITSLVAAFYGLIWVEIKVQTNNKLQIILL